MVGHGVNKTQFIMEVGNKMAWLSKHLLACNECTSYSHTNINSLRKCSFNDKGIQMNNQSFSIRWFIDNTGSSLTLRKRDFHSRSYNVKKRNENIPPLYFLHW